MVFTTDGRVHHGGIRNEKDVVAFVNTASTILKPVLMPAGTTFEHRGGTHTKADAETMNADGTVSEGTSIKNHKTGTFDWMNTTSELPQSLKDSLGVRLKAIKQSYSVHKKLPIARKEVNDLFSEELASKFNSNFLKNLLSGVYKKYPKHVVINNKEKKQLVYFNSRENMKEVATYSDFTYSLKRSPRAKTSASIWRTNPHTGEEVNTHLRIRLVLNNGVTALLGISKANNTSSPCLKIQQDNVAKFLSSLVNPVKESYSAPAT